MHISPSDLVENIDKLAPEIKKMLGGNLSEAIQTYLCGDRDKYLSHFGSSCDGDTAFEVILCKDRNLQVRI